MQVKDEDDPTTKSEENPMNQDVGASESLRAQLMNSLAFRLYRCGNLLSKTGTKAMEPHGVTTQQWAVVGVLARVHRANEIAAHKLVSVLMVCRQNLTSVLSRMEIRSRLSASHQKDGSAGKRCRTARSPSRRQCVCDGNRRPVARPPSGA